MNKKDLHRKNKQLIIVVLLLTVLTILLSGLLIVREQVFREIRNETNEVDRLLFNDMSKVKGYACGIFTEQQAKEFLGADPLKRNIVNMSGATTLEGQLEIVHNDGCYYQSEANDTIYAQILIRTYATRERAQKMLRENISPVSDSIQKESLLKEADKVLYDAGVHYILKDRQVIEISAANGTSSTVEEFSEDLVKILQDNL